MMQRNLHALADTVFDVLVVGGGIHGAWLVLDAALRGLTVGLIEREDFVAATSANSLKIIHGGLRYLQHGDFRRMRASIEERRVLLRIAPHLVRPLPVLMPTYGHGLHRKALWRTALWINDLIGYDRNRHLDPAWHLPRGRILGRSTAKQLLPGLPIDHVSGAAVFYDAQVVDSERLPLACLHAASQAGAVVANYTEARRLLTRSGRIRSVEVEDRLTGQRFDIQAKAVINATGPGIGALLPQIEGHPLRLGLRHAKAMNLVTRSWRWPYAVGLPGTQPYQDADRILNQGQRFWFVSPWRGYSLVGTHYRPMADETVQPSIEMPEVIAFLNDINHAYPAAALRLEDVTFVHCGLVPIADSKAPSGDLRLAKHPRLLDHRVDGVTGLWSVCGVKYTTARLLAVQVVDHVLRSWGQMPSPSRTATHPLYGAEVGRFTDLVKSAMRQRPAHVPQPLLTRLLETYGTAYSEVLNYVEAPMDQIDAQAITEAQIRYGVHQEMAQRLADVVLRRTQLGTAAYPGEANLCRWAAIVGAVLGWDAERQRQEIEDVDAVYPVWAKQEPQHGTALAGTSL